MLHLQAEVASDVERTLIHASPLPMLDNFCYQKRALIHLSCVFNFRLKSPGTGTAWLSATSPVVVASD
jgi:hypothetical protein